MPTVDSICQRMEQFAPSSLAEDWDNVGLLVGDRDETAKRVMTCLTVTPSSCQEAIARRADLVITHHPLPFRALKRITTETTPGRLLWQLIRAGVAVYSPHTAFDSTHEGINQQLAAALELRDIAPLVPNDDDPSVGAGRSGTLLEAVSIEQLARQIGSFVQQPLIRGVDARTTPIERVAIACGSAGEFIGAAAANECHALVTGETSFHTCLEAQAIGVDLILLGHFSSERFAVVQLADWLQADMPELDEVWASEQETDPIRQL